MRLVNVLSGDLEAGPWLVGENGLGGFLWRPGAGPAPSQAPLVGLADQVASVRVVTSRPRRQLLPAAALGAVGYALAGPLGLIGGLLVAGTTTEHGFILRFVDRRCVMATADYATLNHLLALCVGEGRHGGPVIDGTPAPVSAA